MRKEWIKAVNRIDLKTKNQWCPSKFDVVCSKHFKIDDFTQSRHCQMKVLKPGTVPSIFSWKQVQEVTLLLANYMNQVVLSKSKITSFHKYYIVFLSSCFVKAAMVHCLQTAGRQTRISLKAAEELEEPLPGSPPTSQEDDSTPSTEVVAIDHSYSFDTQSQSLKRKFDEMREELKETKQQLANSLRREKRAKLSVASLLTELKQAQNLSEEAGSLLEAYKGITTFPLLSVLFTVFYTYGLHL